MDWLGWLSMDILILRFLETLMFKPMLASDANLDSLRYPLIASPKLDGVRATVRDGVVYSRSNKPIPNKHVHSLFKNYEYFDGELIVGDPTSPTVYRDTVSEVMSHDKTKMQETKLVAEIPQFKRLHAGF